MTVCKNCNMEMNDPSVETCAANTEVKFPDGTVLSSVRYDPKSMHLPHWFRCPDCNVLPGGRHHWNCDQEYCPKCGGQLISCDCFSQE